MRIGSLFSGVAGLDRAVEQFFDADVAWFVEYDKAPSKVLAHHYPGVPNYGDVTAVDWASVEPVDILTGGFPCQDVSLAGARKGLKDGTRSGLWSEYAKAIDVLSPSLVVIENVRGLLSAKTMEEADGKDSDLEWFQRNVGEIGGRNRPVLNAFGRVLADLAELGYDADWVGVRASDAGAPHGRFRVFILAHPKSESWGVGDGNDVRDGCGTLRRVQAAGGSAAQNADLATGGERRIAAPGQAEGGRARANTGRRSGTPTADTAGSGFDGRARDTKRRPVERAVTAGGRTDITSDADGRGGSEGDHPAGISTEGQDRTSVAHERGPRPGGTEWGVYEPAIRRWETVLGRESPAPTNPDGKNGAHRLSARFVEFMMGWPDGWVIAPEIGLTRNEQLKACGNGVVTKQASLALSLLWPRVLKAVES